MWDFLWEWCCARVESVRQIVGVCYVVGILWEVLGA